MSVAGGSGNVGVEEGFTRDRKNDRSSRYGLLEGRHSTPSGDNHVNLEPHELGSDFRDTFTASLAPAKFDYERAPLDPAQLSQPLCKGRCPGTPG